MRRIACVALFFVSALCLGQTTIHVPADRASIQAAIDAAANGDTVLVAAGTYNENLDLHGKAIAVLSEQGAASTIIDGQRTGSVITFQNGESRSTLISGFTIRNGQASFGSAVYALGSSPTLSDNIFVANIAGGIWGNSSSMALERNLFSQAGCGSFGTVAFVNGSSPSVKDNVFSNNPCTALNITVPEGNIPDVANNTFVDNNTGLFVDARIKTNQHLYRNNLFYRNHVGLEVGYAFNNAANYPTLSNNLSFGNTTNYVGFPDPTGSNGNIAANPLLGGLTASDFHPDSGSPAIDAGANAAVGGGDADFYGDTRIRNGVVDIGAGEYIGAPPIVTINKDKDSIVLGESFTLSWTATDASNCTADGSWTGSRPLIGTESITPSAGGTPSYRLICTNTSAARAALVAITVYSAPAITLTLGSSTVPQDGYTQLTWSATPATSCTASGAWTGSIPTSGSLTVGSSSPGTYTYGLSCTGPGGSSSASTQLTVLPRPVVSLTLDHGDIAAGATALLTWSVTNATSCSASGNWSGSKPLSGSQTVGPLPIGQYLYAIQCTGTGGTKQVSVTLSVDPPPQITFTAAPNAIQVGTRTLLTWSAKYAASCTATGGWSGAIAPQGSQQILVEQTGVHEYIVICDGPGGRSTVTTSVTAYAQPTINMSVSPTALLTGEAATLTWSSTDSKNCLANDAWSGAVNTSGNQSISQSSAGTYTYQLTCTGLGGGTATSSVILTVNARPTQPSSDSGGGGGGAMTSGTLVGLMLLLLAQLGRRRYS